jgi:UV DNA damage endonuclease
MKIGYACINMTLGKSATTGRTMVKKTFESKGIDKVSELALLNCKDIIKILEWNVNHGIYFFRLGSGIIPMPTSPINWTKEEIEYIRNFN